MIRVLPTGWRRKPAGIETASLSPYTYIDTETIGEIQPTHGWCFDCICDHCSRPNSGSNCRRHELAHPYVRSLVGHAASGPQSGDAVISLSVCRSVAPSCWPANRAFPDDRPPPHAAAADTAGAWQRYRYRPRLFPGTAAQRRRRRQQGRGRETHKLGRTSCPPAGAGRVRPESV